MSSFVQPTAQNPKDIQFTVRNAKERQQLFIFEKLELVNFGHLTRLK